MSIIQAIILGLIQGLTEFIPISSSGHLVIAHHLLGVQDRALAFDVALHLGTLIALVIFFWKDLGVYISAIFKKSEHTKLAHLLIVSTIPAAVIGYLLESKAESQFRSVKLVAMNMMIFGLIMLLAERIYERHKNHTRLDGVQTNQALAMGFAQAIAIVPGVSRSGSTITAGLFMGLSRVAATRFSFLLGIPITAGAILKVFSEGGVMQSARDQQSIFIVGIITALLSGLFAIKFMLSYLGKHGLHIFAYYRIAFALVVVLALSIY